MRFHLRTGFGKSKISYGGTHEEWLAGYGQGNVAAGPGFTAMSLLIVMPTSVIALVHGSTPVIRINSSS
jgi:hypothetical protein